jgi:hypothetical protein
VSADSLWTGGAQWEGVVITDTLGRRTHERRVSLRRRPHPKTGLCGSRRRRWRGWSPASPAPRARVSPCGPLITGVPRYRHLPAVEIFAFGNTEADHDTRPGSCDSEGDCEVEGRGQVHRRVGGLPVGRPPRRLRRILGRPRLVNSLRSPSEPSFASRHERTCAAYRAPSRLCAAVASPDPTVSGSAVRGRRTQREAGPLCRNLPGR